MNSGPPLNIPEFTPPPPASHKWIRQNWKWLLPLAAVVFLGGGGALAWALWPQETAPVTNSTPKTTPSPTPTPTPATKASPLTGVMVEPAIANRPIVSVIIENSPEARPQSGLAEAGVVYEALAEGGITRFQAFFLENQPASIGPVRSLRPYFVDWGVEYAAPVAHAGGSAEALSLAGPAGLASLNALAIGAPTFFRTRDRTAPHNLYTSGALLDQLLSKRGLAKPAAFAPTPRKADTPNATPAHPNIRIPFSSGLFQADYTYDPVNNNYSRKIAGVPHIDRNTGSAIKVKNVVVEYTPTSVKDSQGHMAMTTIGRGQAILFRDGTAIPCTWVKDTRNSRTKLVDANGTELPLNAGNTWYSIVPTGKPVTY